MGGDGTGQNSITLLRTRWVSMSLRPAKVRRHLSYNAATLLVYAPVSAWVWLRGDHGVAMLLLVTALLISEITASIHDVATSA